jgi:hypothetical protein
VVAAIPDCRSIGAAILHSVSAVQLRRLGLLAILAIREVSEPQSVRKRHQQGAINLQDTIWFSRLYLGGSFCGKDLKYLKAPMQGWKGVKVGVMTIGEQRQEFKA